MSITLLKIHSDCDWEIEVEQANETKKIHIKQGMGLLGEWDGNALVKNYGLFTWPRTVEKCQEHLAKDPENKRRLICIRLASECPETIKELFAHLRNRVPLSLVWFLHKGLQSMPSVEEITQQIWLVAKPTWKRNELLRFCNYRQDVLAQLCLSIDPDLNPEKLEETALEKLLDKAQELTQDKEIHVVRLLHQGWIPILATVNPEQALELYTDHLAKDTPCQHLVLKPMIKSERKWRVVGHHLSGYLLLKCENTFAYGRVNLRTEAQDPLDQFILAISPDLKAWYEQMAVHPEETINLHWPENYNDLVELITEEKSFHWDTFWRLTTEEKKTDYATRHLKLPKPRTKQLALTHGREKILLLEIESDLHRIPACNDLQGLIDSLCTRGYFKRDFNKLMQLIDPELKIELEG